MNINEECLLLFLKNPGRIDKTTDKLILNLDLSSDLLKRENIIKVGFTENNFTSSPFRCGENKNLSCYQKN
jgi:hypothetical protein